MIRKLVLLVPIAGLLAAATAHATPMTVSGTLDLALTGTTATPIAATGSLSLLGGAEATGSDNDFTFTALLVTSLSSIQTQTSTLVRKPIDGPIVQGLGMFLDQPVLGTGTFGASFDGTTFGGSAGLTRLFMTPALSTGAGTPTPFVTLGLSGVGLPSTKVSTLTLGGATFTMDQFDIWRTGLVAITMPTTGAGTRVFSASGSDARTIGGAGTLTMVTPVRIDSTVDGAGFGGFATLTLTFSEVPEPGTPLLLAGAVLSIAIAQRRRRAARS